MEATPWFLDTAPHYPLGEAPMYATDTETIAPLTSAQRGKCPHQPACPAADAADREAARIVAFHPEQGWSLLCNGIVEFDDTGEMLPDGRTTPPHRPTDGIPVAG